MGTLGAGNHYAEIQVVEEVCDKPAARKMGIDKVGQVCIMIHSGSRGLGHQVTPLLMFLPLQCCTSYCSFTVACAQTVSSRHCGSAQDDFMQQFTCLF